MQIREFQERIEELYLERDRARGTAATFMWFAEEFGELARAIARPNQVPPENLREEFADVLAWLSTLASLTGVDLEEAATAKYASGCPKCGGAPCRCE